MAEMLPDGNNNEEDTFDFVEFLDQDYDFDPLQRGDIREAEILEIRPTEIVVDMGVKRDGIVPPQDIERLDPQMLRSLRVGSLVRFQGAPDDEWWDVLSMGPLRDLEEVKNLRDTWRHTRRASDI